MPEIIRNRTIRPSSRAESSKSYKIETSSVTAKDTLIVNLIHESKPFKQTFKFSGSSIASKDSISFRVNDFGTRIDISWSGAKPLSNIHSSALPKATPKTNRNSGKKEKAKSSNHKQSLFPISDSKSKVLILGTMPGEVSLSKQEYYAHPRNLFWRIVAEITGNELPISYSQKKELLLKECIAIWDVCEECVRESSLDSEILDEMPNDLDAFLREHPSIKAIAFNGDKASKFFEKYFRKYPHLEYIELPSTSPANVSTNWQTKINKWKYLKNVLDYKKTDGRADVNDPLYRRKKTIDKEPEFKIPKDEEELRVFIKEQLNCPLPIRENEKFEDLKLHLLWLWKRVVKSQFKSRDNEFIHIYLDDEERDFQLSEDTYEEMNPIAVNLITWIDEAKKEFMEKCKALNAIVADSSVYDKHYLNRVMSNEEIIKLAKSNNISYFLSEINHEIIAKILLKAIENIFQELVSTDKIRFCARCNIPIGVTDNGIITNLMLVEVYQKVKGTATAHAYPCGEQEALMKTKVLYRKKSDEIDFDMWFDDKEDKLIPIELFFEIFI